MRLPGEFDLHALQTFALTVELGGMTAAAQELRLSQSAVSQAILRLERGVGTPLFDRAQRPLALTPAGRALFDRTQTLLIAARDTLDAARAGADQPVDTISIGMSETLATALTAPLLATHGHRVGRWRLRAGISARQHADFLARRIDLLVTGSNLLENEPGLAHHFVVSDPFLLIFPADYRGPTEPGAVQGLSFVRYARDTGMGQRIERHLTRRKLALAPAIEVDITHQQLTTVAVGMGWSITSLLCLAAQPGLLERLRVLPLTGGRLSRRIEVVARNGEFGTLPALTAALAREVLREHTFPPLIAHLPWVAPLIGWD